MPMSVVRRKAVCRSLFGVGTSERQAKCWDRRRNTGGASVIYADVGGASEGGQLAATHRLECVGESEKRF